jgi:fucose permease
VTAFLAAGIAGARLVSSFGVKRLVVIGLSLASLGLAWLTRLPVGADYVTDLLPALLLLGVAIGLSAPSVQIGALTGVPGHTAGLASGLVETLREVGGAVGIAAASTVLTARTEDANALADPTARTAALFDGYQSALTVTLVLAVLVAAIAFPRSSKGDAPVDADVAEPAGIWAGSVADPGRIPAQKPG